MAAHSMLGGCGGEVLTTVSYIPESERSGAWRLHVFSYYNDPDISWEADEDVKVLGSKVVLKRDVTDTRRKDNLQTHPV